MATASSAQREPSMEEILASIRRIIEDSDSGRKQAEDMIEAGEPTASDEAVAPVVDAFRAGLHEATAESKPMTLADVQAGLSVAETEPAEEKPDPRPAITLAEVGAKVAADQGDGPYRAANADSITQDWQRDIATAASPARDPVGATVSEPNHPEDEATASEAMEAAPISDNLAQQQAEPAGMASEDEVPAKSALISEQTSRQVAAAFGELSEAFASRSRKSFDEMAEAMLRPMLQDWLDNNLPTLVERLVREEIERVARGG